VVRSDKRAEIDPPEKGGGTKQRGPPEENSKESVKVSTSSRRGLPAPKNAEGGAGQGEVEDRKYAGRRGRGKVERVRFVTSRPSTTGATGWQVDAPSHGPTEGAGGGGRHPGKGGGGAVRTLIDGRRRAEATFVARGTSDPLKVTSEREEVGSTGPDRAKIHLHSGELMADGSGHGVDSRCGQSGSMDKPESGRDQGQ